MTFVVSYHTVDLDLIHERLIPCLLGEGAINDLVQVALDNMWRRHRANAWCRGVMGLSQPPASFEVALHLHGRPFLVEADTPREVSEAVDRYYESADVEALDAVAADMLEALRSGLSQEVAPHPLGELPSRETLLLAVPYALNLLGRACRAMRDGQARVEVDGKEVRSRSLVERESPLVILDFLSELRSGWVAEGRLWPTYFLRQLGVDVSGFVPFSRSLEPLNEALGGRLDMFSFDGIVEDNTVGGYLPVERVEGLLEELEGGWPRLEAAAAEQSESAALALRKIREALYDAARLGHGFAEASGIYAGLEDVASEG